MVGNKQNGAAADDYFHCCSMSDVGPTIKDIYDKKQVIVSECLAFLLHEITSNK